MIIIFFFIFFIVNEDKDNILSKEILLEKDKEHNFENKFKK
jgi:hypothetical protein